MKFSCIRSYFLNAASSVERIIEKNSTLPILQNIFIKVEKGKTTLSTTNLEIGIHASFQSKADEEGSFTVPAKTLLNFLMYVDTEKITVHTKGTNLIINAGSHKADIKGLDATNFPIIPEITESFSTSLPAEEFFSALSSLTFLSSMGDLRPELAGVFCSFEKNQLRMAATDSFRLGEFILKIPTPKKETTCIIPTRTVNEIIRLFTGAEAVTLKLSANQILIKTQEKELISRLIEEKYPDYTAVIPTSSTTRTYLKREEFMQALRAASVFSGKTREVKINIFPEEKKYIIESRNADIGEHKSEISCDGNGKNVTVSVNYQYFLDALGKISDEMISFENNNETDPILLKGLAGAGPRYIIMPLRSY
ncbi:MAG: DNA polymerase III subunit beta [bacterium]|nr:DNA polymerase III subunit beta [bacterium]